MSMPKSSFSNPREVVRTTQDASFPSHLNGGVIHSLVSSFSSHPIFLKTHTVEDGEIEVFNAEKYFKEGINQSPKFNLKNSLSHHHQKDDSLEVFSIKEESKIGGAQSSRSESSWNIRSVSFQNISRNQKKPRKGEKKCFLTSIRCRCPCTGRNSVDIDDLSGEDCSRKNTNIELAVSGKSLQGDEKQTSDVRESESDYNYVKFNEPELRANSGGHFSFRVTANQAGKMRAQDEGDQASRKSLEVIENRMEGKKLAVMDWEAAVAEEIKIPCGMHVDSGSDASSDLFEIKSLSKGSPLLSRQVSDGLSLSGSITPKTCHAPSEASMEWGVISPTAADYEESTSAISCPWEFGQDPKINSFKEIHEHHPRIIVPGDNSLKAVSLTEDVHRTI